MENRLNIAGVEIPSRFFLAPLAGYTDYAFRSLAREYGAGMVYTEMVSVSALARRIKNSYKYMKKKAGEDPVALQIFGGRLDEYPAAVSENDLSAFAFIDINMGCPVRKVVNSGGGSSLLRDISKMQRAVRSIKENTDIPVSVKIRLGYRKGDAQETERALALEDAGAAFVAVHGRYTDDMFKDGTMRRDKIAEIKSALSIPVVGNGDVRNKEEARSFFDETNVDAIMIGRAAVGAPWIFAELNSLFGGSYSPPSKTEVESVMRRHFHDVLDIYGEGAGVRFMRKFFIRYLAYFETPKAKRIELMKCETAGDVEAYLDDFFSE